MADLAEYRDTVMHPDWVAMGWTGRCQHIMGQETIWTYDPVAMGSILQSADVWERAKNTERLLRRITGSGMLTAKGAAHRRQRRIVNPAFSTTAIKAMVPAMFEKAELCATLLGRCVDDDSLESFASRYPPKPEDRVPGARKVDMLALCSKLTQDVIGAAGFNTDLESLRPADNPLDNSIQYMLNTIFDDTIISMGQNLYWLLDKIPTRTRRAMKTCRTEMERVSERLMTERAAKQEGSVVDADEDKVPDMLDLLLKANSAEREDQRLSDEEVRSQLSTLLFAGSTTTAGTICSLLRFLALHPDIQARLREEIEATEERPSFETLNALPLLDATVRETLRLEPAATCTVRTNTKDTVIPLSVPVRGRDGTMIEKALPVAKGSYVLLSISSLQRHPDVWGPDAEEFNPDRYKDPSIPKMNIPGMWGGLASFISGPHHCIGWRLALAEIKIVTFTLLRHFAFEELPSKPDIFIVMNVASRPEVKGESGGQMPLLVRRIEA
ncbi:cytochrome P450 [Cutaneotrichosporon oleaginosum]|uniref:Cytochrome P450 n=1 Tax=Cutaneotrichosporon oleaginosum TaxID=879819 RepID=A0A0J0XM02_9TREE|nr:cytochrome P450 [Cutaneotrichosporon oleaginosum]KLT42140.1 cytochrome P450 [Cutaneotrichosporon oleaginosum]